MRNVQHALISVVASLVFVVNVLSEYVVLRDNGPVVTGANVTIWATVYTDDHEIASGRFIYTWEDEALPKHYYKEESTNPYAEWNVSYPSPQYYSSVYLIQVKVDVKPPHWYSDWRRCSERILVNITDVLKGNLYVHQNATLISNNSFVSSTQPMTFEIGLHQPDMDFLRNNATQISSYWFIDCYYYGTSSGFSFNNTFKDVGNDHDVDVVIVASFDKPVPVPTTATTTTTTTITRTTPSLSTSLTTPSTANSRVSVVTSTISANASNSSASIAAISSSASTNLVASTTPMTPTGNTTANETGPSTPPNYITPYMCLNSSDIPQDGNRIYGYFRKRVSVRAPVENLTYIGTNWIQPGNILDLNVSCNGSGMFTYCAYPESSDYNITGNESCLFAVNADNCTFRVQHFLKENKTMVIVVANVVSKGVLGVKINLYNAQKHRQLSVIVVPVTCGIIAAVLIVFGVAYYVQSRARFTVEIADFDFGMSDEEYKTFSERLRDAVSNAVHGVVTVNEENTATSSGVKYDSLQ